MAYSPRLVEELNAQGKTSIELGLRDREGARQVCVRDPVVTVSVTSFVGPYSEQIRVVGGGQTPGPAVQAKMSLLDVMIAVGGLTDLPPSNRATIVRTVEGNKVYSVRHGGPFSSGATSANVENAAGRHPHHPQSVF